MLREALKNVHTRHILYVPVTSQESVTVVLWLSLVHVSHICFSLAVFIKFYNV